MKNFLQKNKTTIIIFIFFCLVALASGLMYYLPEKQIAENDSAALINNQTSTAAGIASTLKSSEKNSTGQINDNPATQQNQDARPPVRQESETSRPAKPAAITPDIKTINSATGSSGETAEIISDSNAPIKQLEDENTPKVEPKTANGIYVSLNINQDKFEITLPVNSTVYDLMNNLKNTDKLDFKTKNYSGLGLFVDEINGLKNNAQPGYYWIYYINNKQAQTGISNYEIKPGDAITWKYEKDKF